MTAPFRLENGIGTDIIGEVPLESIEITELAPGGVSSMTFTISDPGKAHGVSRLERFLLVNQVGADANVFRGYATSATARPVAIGREIDVTCAGPEYLLDSLIAPAKTIAAATNFPSAVASIFTAKTGSFNTTVGSGIRTGNKAGPIGDWVHPTYGVTPFLTGGAAYTIPAGTLRYQVEQLHQMSAYDNAGTKVAFGALLTIDHNLGVRLWEDFAGTNSTPTDWTILPIVDTPSGTFQAGELKHTTDWSDYVDNVYVIGTGVTGFVGSGGVPGQEQILSDPDIDSNAERDIAGANYLLQHGITTRGSFTLEDWTPSLNYHAGGLVTLTDANVGISAVTYRISEIRKRFFGTGRQTWEVSYGKPQASAMRQIRSITRGQQ